MLNHHTYRHILYFHALYHCTLTYYALYGHQMSMTLLEIEVHARVTMFSFDRKTRAFVVQLMSQQWVIVHHT